MENDGGTGINVDGDAENLDKGATGEAMLLGLWCKGNIRLNGSSWRHDIDMTPQGTV